MGFSQDDGPAVQATEGKDGSVVYTVKMGDSLESIGRKFTTTKADIIRLNSLPENHRLSIGEQLIVQNPSRMRQPNSKTQARSNRPSLAPVSKSSAKTTSRPTASSQRQSTRNAPRSRQVSPDVVTYTVQTGETLRGICTKFRISLGEIINLNNLSSPFRIHAGMKLLIPVRNDPSSSKAQNSVVMYPDQDPEKQDSSSTGSVSANADMRSWISQAFGQIEGVDFRNLQMQNYPEHLGRLLIDSKFKPYFGKAYEELIDSELNALASKLNGIRNSFKNDDRNIVSGIEEAFRTKGHMAIKTKYETIKDNFEAQEISFSKTLKYIHSLTPGNHSYAKARQEVESYLAHSPLPLWADQRKSLIIAAESLRAEERLSVEDRYNKAMASYEAGAYTTARSILNDCLFADAKNQEALTSRGWCEIMLKEYKQAQVDLLRATKSNPENLRAITGLAIVNKELKRYGNASVLYKTALKITPEDPSLHMGLALSEYLYILNNRKVSPFSPHSDYRRLLKESIAYISKAIELNPDYAEARRLRATAYARCGQRSLALIDADAAVKLSPNDPLNYWIQAWVYRKVSSKPESAIPILRKAISLDSSNTNYLTTLDDWENNRDIAREHMDDIKGMTMVGGIIFLMGPIIGSPTNLRDHRVDDIF